MSSVISLDLSKGDARPVTDPAIPGSDQKARGKHLVQITIMFGAQSLPIPLMGRFNVGLRHGKLNVSLTSGKVTHRHIFNDLPRATVASVETNRGSEEAVAHKAQVGVSGGPPMPGATIGVSNTNKASESTRVTFNKTAFSIKTGDSAGSDPCWTFVSPMGAPYLEGGLQKEDLCDVAPSGPDCQVWWNFTAEEFWFGEVGVDDERKLSPVKKLVAKMVAHRRTRHGIVLACDTLLLGPA